MKEFLIELQRSEFNEPYSEKEKEIIFRRVEKEFKNKLYKAIKRIVKRKGYKLNILDNISVFGSKISIGEIVIQIFGKAKPF